MFFKLSFLHRIDTRNVYNGSRSRFIKSRRVKQAVNAESKTGEMRNTHNTLIGKTHGKRGHGTARHVWENNIKVGVTKEQSMKMWTGLLVPDHRLMAAFCEKGNNTPSSSMKYRESLECLSD